MVPLLIISCEKKKDLCIAEADCINGAWINPVYSNDEITFSYNVELKENDYGLLLNKNGTLIERKNSGWCGTPPISYADFEGNWSEENSVLLISVGFWGGTAKYKWEILSINSNNLKVKIIEDIYEYK